MPHPIEVPSEIVGKWQGIVDLLAEVMHVPSALIMRVDPPNIKVFVSSESEGNPYEPDEAASLNTGLYCETVMKTRRPLLVADALQDEAWKSNPDIKLGMISYLGVPITWPDGEIFGTICVLDDKKNEYSKLYLKLLLQWRDVLQDNLRSLATAHKELERRETKIRRLVDANIIGIFIWDFEGRILEANDAFLRIVGYDREDLASGRLRWTDLTPPEWLERHARQWVPELKATGSLQPYEKEYFRKDGSRVPVLVGAATFEEGGNQGVTFVLDLTERKRAEQELRASEARFRTFVDHASEAFILHDEHGIVVDVNRHACESLGYSRDEMIGMAPADFDPDATEAHTLSIRKRLEAGEIVTFEGRQRRKDGTTFPVEVRLRQFRQAGRRLGFSLIRDITERKRAEAEARESERRYREMQMELAHANRVATTGQLTVSIAHEVKQPITATVANARAALRFLGAETVDLNEIRQILTDIVKDVNRAGEVISRIRAFIKKAPPRSDLLEINGAIREVVELTRGEAVKHAISVRAELADGLPLIQGDRVQLQQVILNLIFNAVEAMSGTGDDARELLISTGKTGSGGVLVSVRDSGPGLAPAGPDRLFDPFYTTKPSGLGLGLSICRSIVEAHGGRLWAMANVPRGAIFEFTLPAQSERRISAA